MNRQIFTWEIPNYELKSHKYWWEWLCFLGLLLGALFLFYINLGALPLRDWDEGTFAQVAKEIYQSSFSELRWLFPTIWQQPYLNKPPLIHSLTALVYHWMGISEFSTRFVGATLTAFSVPCLYLLARELFLPRYYALFSALVYLTTMPVLRHGRLAMLDGATLCFQILLFLFLLKTRRNLRWALPSGICLALICLTKGWMMGVLLGAIALIFILWDTPRLLKSLYLWAGIILGTTPVVAWYLAQYSHYGEQFIDTTMKQQSVERIFTAVEGHQEPIWYYILELLKYPHPWIFIALWGIKSAWQHRNLSWGKFVLVNISFYLLAISLMGTKLPWYIIPIYPALSLAAGVALGETKYLPASITYPKPWIIFFSLLSIGTIAGLSYFAITEPNDQHLLVIFILLFITFLTAAILLAKKDSQFIPILFWGMFISLMVFVYSSHWLWELNESFAVKPVAEKIREIVPDDKVVYIDFDYERPSLNFYSHRQVLPLPQGEGGKRILLGDLDTYLVLNEQITQNTDDLNSLCIHSYCFELESIPKSDFVILKPLK